MKTTSWTRVIEKRNRFIQSQLGYSCDVSELFSKGANVEGSPVCEIWKKTINDHAAGAFVLAGFQADGNAALYDVNTGYIPLSGKSELPFSVNGSGFHFAYSSLVTNWPKSTPEISTEDATYTVYCAKKAAEVSDGVGKSINLAILTRTGFNNVTHLQPTLEGIRVERQSLRADERAIITSALNEFQETK